MFVKLKGLSRYEFKVVNERLVIRNSKGMFLSGHSHTDGNLYYRLLADDGKYKSYTEKTLRFYIANPQFPAYINNLTKKTGIHLTDDGTLITDFKRKRRYNVFSDLNDAMNTLLLIKSWQNGDKTPVLLWLKDARINARYTLARFGHRRVTACLDAAEERFKNQLNNYNVQRIMPLFAMFCKCIKVEMLNRKKEITTEHFYSIVDKVSFAQSK